ncbi:hypothetical protein KY363_04540 [Candidatus Woesearchaeota archaeon]|nr:hypothetical protein [Candidatus Woesearchaeota archaeon]
MANATKTKPAIGFYDLTGCQGCQLSILFNEPEVLDLISHIDIKAFRFVKGAKDEKQFDIVFIEGLVACQKDMEILKSLREKTKILVALGSCACTGCIPAYRNFIDSSKYAYLVYERVPEAKDVPATPISEHVKVDYFIPGCPPDKKQIAKFIKDILQGKNPYDYDRPVCFECRLNQNRCLLDDGKMCLGPITRGGCESVCTNGKLECWGCRGPMPDANLQLMSKLLEQKGFAKEHIKQRLRTFAGMMMEKPVLKVVEPKKPPKPKKAKKAKAVKKPVKKPAKKVKATKPKAKPKKAKKPQKPKKAKKAKAVKKPVKKPAKKVKANKPKAKPKKAKKQSLISKLKKKLNKTGSKKK